MSDRNSTDRGDSPETVCPRCAVGCRLRRGSDGNGDASDPRAEGREGPANPEGRLCRRGVRAFAAAADADRLTTPLVRRDGELVPASWETALDRVVDGFEEVIDARGPDALAFLGAPHCTNEENYLLGKLARTLGTNNVDNRARLCHAAVARALADRVGWPATTNGLDDLPDADVVVVAGANPAARQPVAFDSFVRPAVNDGTALVHVDPVGNETTRLADVHVAPRPGADATVFDLLCARVADAGGVDCEFVDARTRDYDAFADELAAFDRERARSAAGVDGETVGRVVDLLTDADRVAVLTGTGVEGDGDAADSILDLLLLTGNLGRRGTGLFVLRGLANEQGATDAGCVPDRLPGHRPVTDPAARARVADEWGVEPPSEPGATASDLLASFGDGVRAALVVGEDPATSKRSTEWVRERLGALDTLVVAEAFESDTTAFADVVLSAAVGVEKEGTVTNLDRRVQRMRATADPPGAARPDFAVLRELGRRLVGEAAFDFEDPGEAFDELARVAPTHAGLSYASLDGDGHRWPADRGGVLYREAFETPDGRAPFRPPRPVAEPDSEPAGGLRLVTGGRASGDAGDAGDDARRADRPLRVHPEDAERLSLESGASVVVRGGGAAVETVVSPDDAVRRGTAYLHAAAADPFLRRGASRVVVEPASAERSDPSRSPKSPDT